jgi:glyoxylase-like metal-dependent hydrolase (beta-lactamase superfamily II)
VRAPAEARERLGPGEDFEPYGDGDTLAPGITAVHVGSLCPDEYALYVAHGPGAISLADALMHYGETLSYVPDDLMGDDPDGVKAGLAGALAGLLDRDFEDLLFAHGEPIVGGGPDALRAFLR